MNIHKGILRGEALEGLATVPNIADAVAPSVESFEALLVAEPNRVDVRLALATLLLPENRIEDAITLLKEVIAVADSAVARCNLGVAYLLLERYQEALIELAKAVLMDSSLVTAHHQLARVQRVLGDLSASAASLERVVAFQRKNVSAICELASTYEALQQSELPGESSATTNYLSRATELHEAALVLDPHCEAAQIALGRREVQQGVALFEAGALREACEQWGATYRRYPRVFSADAGVQQYLKDCRAQARQQDVLTSAQHAFFESNENRTSAYVLVLYYLFLESLIPECFEDEATLEQQRAYWRSQTSTDKVFPYAHYRLGIVEGYCGDFAAAAEELLYARDYFPASKHRSLRVEELSAFFRELRDRIRANSGPTIDDSSEASWEAHGFTDEFSQQAWRQTGCAPQEAAQWRALSVRAKEVPEWRKQGISPLVAKEWIAAGTTTPSEVKRWSRAEISPTIAGLWRGEFIEDISLAIQCIQLGFIDPVQAKIWLAEFMFPWEAIAWLQSEFTPEEAKKWKKVGIKDPFLARQLRDEEETIFREARAAQEAQLLQDANGVAEDSALDEKESSDESPETSHENESDESKH